MGNSKEKPPKRAADVKDWSGGLCRVAEPKIVDNTGWAKISDGFFGLAYARNREIFHGAHSGRSEAR